VERARAGEGPILIEAKTFRRRGHAQHDPAEYVPAEMRDYWERRDPIALCEKFLMEQKLLDAKGKKEIDDKLNAVLEKDREFAENSPMPPPEIAEQGVYCTGDDCHKIRAKWERPVDELLPPKSCVEPVWLVEGFGRGGSSSGVSARIHFGDVPSTTEQPAITPTSPLNPTRKSTAKSSPKRPPAKKLAKKGSR